MAAPAPYGEIGGADPMAPSSFCTQERLNPELVNIFGARRLATAGLQLAAAMMTRAWIIQRYIRVKFTLFCCTTEDTFFSFCDSVAAPRQRPWHHDQVAAYKNERCRGHLPRHQD
jgi:hypothetical protein